MADTFPLITAPTLREWLNDRSEIALFDVREAGEFGEAHPFFAIPLPYSRLELDIERLAPRRNVRIVLTDGGSQAEVTARRAARRMQALGYTHVSILEGGVRGWAAVGYTLFKGVNVPSKTFGELVEHACETPRISASELARQQHERVPLVLLDGRTVEEHTKMTIPGAVSCPNGELAYRIGPLATDPRTPIVVHCAGRTRSIIGAQLLRNLGLPNPVIALENGTQGWALAGLTLEHGSTRRYPDAVDESSLAQARRRAAALATRFSITTLGARTAQAWLAATDRTTYLLDVRSAEEFARDGVPAAVHAPGGQLLQATDQTIGVRRARVLLVDHDAVRAPVIATWLAQMGIESALVVAQDAASLQRPAPRARQPAVPQADLIDADGLRELNGASIRHLIDLRSSAAYRKQHPAGARWSIRPRLLDTLASSGARASDPVVLFAETPEFAALAALDLREAGFTAVRIAAKGVGSWTEASLPLDSSPGIPADSERIDHLFFVHDRHEGNLDAARAYLAWETGLIAQCSPDELDHFNIDARIETKAFNAAFSR
ncbi:rhodanese-like domain protein [Paraburkholderia xenovorans LB400]|uniref:Rhodanese-like sulfur transferase n=1 Tax=Paraburkholderia xenovorans (strain LB400) TaxID=266265 RepID=Q13FZ3_PARXL|nr:rhodanese-like domain-containing protein [Paraburkholderia xenovorans]ABE36996.1 Putative rhodanese-like sulfur transferase [Paraburkholderia xenovorans LB400]AIP34745.1 rhodanese-like domain protein [Paraburkholderia xenovorans LB400]